MAGVMNTVIDTLAVSRAILATERKRYTVSVREIVAMAKALVAIAENDAETTIMSAPLAVAICKVVQCHDAMEEMLATLADDLGRTTDQLVIADLALWRAIEVLKARFEAEFPPDRTQAEPDDIEMVPALGEQRAHLRIVAGAKRG